MAEGLIGGILGEEDEKPEVEEIEAAAGAEAFAAAVAAIATRQDPGVARRTEEFLAEQSNLLKIQAAHLKDEHALRLGALRGQKVEARLRRIGIRIRLVFQLLFAIVGVALGAGALLMLRDAVTSRSVVIDPFEAPPALAAEGLSGKMVAAGLLDELTRIQAANRSSAEHRQLSNAWTNDIAIEVPETGISIGELERVLKARFGHDQHIDGDLVTTPGGGLALTVRGTGILPKTFATDSRDLEHVLTEAGEYVYSQSQPGLWAAYLVENKRETEAIQFCQKAYGTIDASERPYLLNNWGNAIAAPGGEQLVRKALLLWREAVRLQPDFWLGYNNILFALGSLGDEEGVVRTTREMMKAAGGRPGKAGESVYQNYDTVVWDLTALHASNTADMESHGGVGTILNGEETETLTIAQIELQMHDVDAAMLRLQTTVINETNPADFAAAVFDRALLAEERGEVQTAAREWDLYASAFTNPVVSSPFPYNLCYAAVTYEKTGQHAKADAALDSAGNAKFVDCLRFRGDVLDLRGDWAGAQIWYAKAVALGPSLPAGYYSWGVALARHGDFPGAAAKLKQANQAGPHWADPLKTWGDVLMRQSDRKQAIQKYDEALKYAPAWVQLKAAHDAAAKPSA
jgi:tetratricopeptide (TPR) repeat protein